MREISEKIAIYINDNVNQSFPINKLRYGIELFLSQSILIISMVLISLMINKLNSVMQFMIPLIFIRTFCGGYHTKTFFECFIITNSICFFSVFFAEYYINSIFYLFLSIISLIIIFIFTPLINHDTNLTRKKINYFIAYIISSFFSLFVLFPIDILNINKNIISLVLAAVATSLLIQYFIKKKKKK